MRIFFYVGIFRFSSPSATSNNVSLLGYASVAEKWNYHTYRSRCGVAAAWEEI